VEPGIVVRFDAERGFGFIRSRSFSADVFVHASVVEGQRLRVGQRVRFLAEETDRGLRAVQVEPGRVGLTPVVSAASGLAVALVGATISLRWAGWPWGWAWMAAVNPTALAVYAWDKRQASHAARWIPETALLGLALLGGSAGAGLGMALLRHKTRKASFLLGFTGIVTVQAVALLAWFWATRS
jgi:uncharacterized membrane protein YsdA (DUF1294 family)/cold shock CspA family protein